MPLFLKDEILVNERKCTLRHDSQHGGNTVFESPRRFQNPFVNRICPTNNISSS